MNNEKIPEISVIITNYNYGDYLEQAIKSVLEQTYKNIKLFIIDDASTDNSNDVLKKYANIATIIRHKKNRGIIHTRNEALEFIKSPYLLFLDADDWLNHDYIQRLASAAQEDNVDVAYSGMQYYIDGEKGMNWIPPEFNLERLKNENYVHSASLLRTAAVRDARFDVRMEKLTHEDWDFFLGLALKGLKFKRVNDNPINYRYKPTGRNITNRDADEKFANLYKHIYEKYSLAYPEQIDYLAYRRFIVGFLNVNEKLTIVEKELDDYRIAVQHVQAQLDTIRTSKSYKLGCLITYPMRVSKRLIRKALAIHLGRGAVKIIKRSRLYVVIDDAIFKTRNKNSKQEKYFLAKDGKFMKESKHAVILHLYYTDNWEDIFCKKLKLITESIDLDIYITLPESNKDYINVIRRDFKHANVFFVPNKGRDVLPFIKVAQVLYGMGYKKVLKIHSKKSTHRDLEGNAAESGDYWLAKMIDSLIPTNKIALQEVISKIDDDTTGMIGAAEYCYPLKMYLKNNRVTIERIMKLFEKGFFMGDLANKLNNFSYFGGTMFWADLDAIRDVLTISSGNFPPEKGQTDTTIAHALERVICLLPQIKGKKVYTISPKKGIQILPAENHNYPDWYFDDISGGKPQISIIVPVYSDWWSLSKNITSLKKYLANSEDISVHYVNDCGPEADILEKKIKENIDGLTNFYYYRNEKNLGFVGTCNKATSELVNRNDDILLLNSDTKVTKDFIVEMRKVLYSQGNIGAVTSRSNNATIWSVPMTSKLANYRVISYLLYRFIKVGLPEKYITPTIHGFCVLIRREVIERYGLFDKIYGRGYGEENDFAMRLRKHGWKCAVANYSFVFHYESRSFGSEVRNEQIAKNEKILLERYPDYRHLVQEYWDNTREPLK